MVQLNASIHGRHVMNGGVNDLDRNRIETETDGSSNERHHATNKMRYLLTHFATGVLFQWQNEVSFDVGIPYRQCDRVFETIHSFDPGCPEDPMLVLR
jgi:hypothetical protein